MVQSGQVDFERSSGTKTAMLVVYALTIALLLAGVLLDARRWEALFRRLARDAEAKAARRLTEDRAGAAGPRGASRARA